MQTWMYEDNFYLCGNITMADYSSGKADYYLSDRDHSANQEKTSSTARV